MVYEALNKKRVYDLAEDFYYILRYIKDNIESKKIVDPSNSQNIISDSLLASEKLAIKKALEDSFKSVSDSPEALDSWFMSQCVSGDYRYPEEFIEEFKNVTREEIIKAASDVTLDTIFMLEGNVEGGETHE
jgi:predicted Zn-dependent peptidase